MLELLRKLWAEDDGQDLAEYALLLTLILLIAAAAITSIGTNAGAIFTKVADRLK